MEVLYDHTVVITLQYVTARDQHLVHLKFMPTACNDI